MISHSSPLERPCVSITSMYVLYHLLIGFNSKTLFHKWVSLLFLKDFGWRIPCFLIKSHSFPIQRLWCSCIRSVSEVFLKSICYTQRILIGEFLVTNTSRFSETLFSSKSCVFFVIISCFIQKFSSPSLFSRLFSKHSGLGNLWIDFLTFQ